MEAGDQQLVHSPFVPAGYWSPCAPLVWNPVKAPNIRFSSSHFRKQHPRHEKALISKEKNWDFVGKLELKKDMLEEQVEKIVQEASQQLDELHHIIEQHKNSEQAIDSNIIPDSIESYGKLQYDLTGSINK
ncbi:unnamed protein product, partial [Schistosoma margrebowiei]